jgi:hypothetical protein
MESDSSSSGYYTSDSYSESGSDDENRPPSRKAATRQQRKEHQAEEGRVRANETTYREKRYWGQKQLFARKKGIFSSVNLQGSSDSDDEGEVIDNSYRALPWWAKEEEDDEVIMRQAFHTYRRRKRRKGEGLYEHIEYVPLAGKWRYRVFFVTSCVIGTVYMGFRAPQISLNWISAMLFFAELMVFLIQILSGISSWDATDVRVPRLSEMTGMPAADYPTVDVMV